MARSRMRLFIDATCQGLWWSSLLFLGIGLMWWVTNQDSEAVSPLLIAIAMGVISRPRPSGT